MRTVLLTTFICSVAWGAFAQGTILVGNHFGIHFRAPIYGPELPFTTGPKSGQSPIGTPAGTTVYTGALLQGTGYTFAVYYGAASVTDPEQLALLVSTTFRTATANQLPAGLVFFREPAVPGVAPGEHARLEVRAWDNQGGTLLTWEMVTNSTTAAFNRSGMFLSAPLGGVTSNDVLFSPEMTGWSSFSIAVIPEPSSMILAGLAGLVFGVWGSRIKL